LIPLLLFSTLLQEIQIFIQSKKRYSVMGKKYSDKKNRWSQNSVIPACPESFFGFNLLRRPIPDKRE